MSQPTKLEQEARSKEIFDFLTTAEGETMSAYMFTKSEQEIIDYIIQGEKIAYEAGAKAERERLVEAIINCPDTFGITDDIGRGGAILVADVISLLRDK